MWDISEWSRLLYKEKTQQKMAIFIGKFLQIANLADWTTGGLKKAKQQQLFLVIEKQCEWNNDSKTNCITKAQHFQLGAGSAN